MWGSAKASKQPDLNENLIDSPNGRNGQNVDLNRVNTFADDGGMGGRTYTFSRAFTFDGAALQRHVSQPFEGLARTITTVGQRFDPDAQFTNAVIADLKTINAKGNEGDVPVSPGFARTWVFWKVIVFTAALSAFMGVATAAFMNFADQVPRQWVQCNYDDDISCGYWYHGKKYFIAIVGGAGFTIGVIRWAFSYPDNLPGIFKDIQTFHVEPKWIPITYLISALSLGGGATLGPEQALGNLGGGLAYYLKDYAEFEDEEYDQVFVLAGMASALGALFPSPMLGALMMHELGEPPKTFMESTIILSVSAIIGFVVYYSLISPTYLEPVSSKGIFLALDWACDSDPSDDLDVCDGPGYQNWQVATGFVIGVISAGLCTMVMMTVGITKQIFYRLRQRLSHNAFLREVLPPTIAGLIIGTINWALPLTVGNGSIEFNYFIEYAANGDVSQKLLLCTGFARMVLLGISMNSGFCGGIIFPFLTMGMIAGALMHVNYPYVPKGLCIGAFMVAIPSGVVPMPFTFTALSVFVFYFGLYQVAPIFMAVITSFLLVSGSGLFKKLVSRAAEQQAAAEEAAKAKENGTTAEEEKISAKHEKEEFLYTQYHGGGRKAGGGPQQSIQATTGSSSAVK